MAEDEARKPGQVYLRRTEPQKGVPCLGAVANTLTRRTILRSGSSVRVWKSELPEVSSELALTHGLRGAQPFTEGLVICRQAQGAGTPLS